MNFKKFYRYFKSPTITIFLVTSLINYATITPTWLMKQAMLSVCCGLVLACIYYSWDVYKGKQKID